MLRPPSWKPSSDMLGAFSVEHVAELTGLEALTICDRWGDKEELAVHGRG
jgi:hypothetical protein